MSALPTARLGDVCSHGAVIITGSGSRSVNGRPSVVLGDLVSCPQPGHGVTPIIAVQTSVSTADQPTIHIAAIARCGAVVISSSADVLTG